MTKYNFLMHHGVKGMKWGVRRYQNYDGTLTAAGRKHVGVKSTRNSNKSSGTFTKEEKHYGDWDQTTYRHKSASGRKKMDSEVEKELKETTDYVRKEYGDSSFEADINSLYGYGDNLNTNLASEGSEFVSKVEKEGKEYAEKWLRESSVLKDYDYELRLEEIDEGEKYVSASLKVFGENYDFSVGVESDYWDDDYFVDKKAEARRQQKIKEYESTKEYKVLQSKLDALQNKLDKIYDETPKGTSVYNNDEYNRLEDEWYELYEQETELRKKHLGKDY